MYRSGVSRKLNFSSRAEKRELHCVILAGWAIFLSLPLHQLLSPHRPYSWMLIVSSTASPHYPHSIQTHHITAIRLIFRPQISLNLYDTMQTTMSILHTALATEVGLS